MIITRIQPNPSLVSKQLFDVPIWKILNEIINSSKMMIDHIALQDILSKFKKSIDEMEQRSLKRPNDHGLMQTIANCLTAHDALSKLKHTLTVLPHPQDLVQKGLNDLQAEMVEELRPNQAKIKANQTWRMKIGDRIFRTIVVFKTDADWVYPKSAKRSDKKKCRLQKISIVQFLENYKLIK